MLARLATSLVRMILKGFEMPRQSGPRSNFRCKLLILHRIMDRSLLSWGTDLVACEFTFGLEPILQITAGLFTAFEINFVCATLDFLLTCRGHYRTFFFPALCGRLSGLATYPGFR